MVLCEYDGVLLNDTRSKHSCVAASPGLDPKLRDLRDGSSYLDDEGAFEVIRMGTDPASRPAEPRCTKC
jgi:hypothetical protein